MKKFLLVLAAALALSVPAFADATNDNYFGSIPASVQSGIVDLSLSQNSGVCYFYVWHNRIYVVSDVPFEIQASGVYSDGGTYNFSFSGGSSALGTWTFYQQGVDNVQSSTFSSVPSVNVIPDSFTGQDIGDAFNDFLNSTPDTPSVQSSFNVPCGNVVYFQVASEQDVTFKSYNQVLSSLLTFSALGPWGDTGQRFGPAAALPSSGTSFPLLSQDPIHWNIDASSVNLLGQSRTAVKTFHCIANQWYAFYNPAYNSNNTDWTVNDITGATVGAFGSFAQVKVYPLEQVVDFSDGTFVGSSNDDYHSYYDGSIDSDGNVTFTDQDGNVSTPSAGGQNLLAPNESYQSLIDRVIGLLDEIVHELKSLFTFGYEAVQDLVGIMRDFVNVLSGLYTWLPAEVYSALMSAVVVAIVIGVFKVFL